MTKNNSEQKLLLKETFLGSIISFLWSAIIASVVFYIIWAFLFMPFRISGHSMEGNYHNGEYILVNRFSYLDFSIYFDDWEKSENIFFQKWIAKIFKNIPVHIGDPERGDVVVVRPNINEKNEFYLKRVIAIPGDTIRLLNGRVFVKTPQNDDFIELQETYLSENNKNATYLPFDVEDFDFILPENAYWVMGDNRLNSSDSRQCFYSCQIADSTHFVDRKDILWKFFLSFWYFQIFGETNFSWEIPPRFFDTPASHIYSELE